MTVSLDVIVDVLGVHLDDGDQEAQIETAITSSRTSR